MYVCVYTYKNIHHVWCYMRIHGNHPELPAQHPASQPWRASEWICWNPSPRVSPRNALPTSGAQPPATQKGIQFLTHASPWILCQRNRDAQKNSDIWIQVVSFGVTGWRRARLRGLIGELKGEGQAPLIFNGFLRPGSSLHSFHHPTLSHYRHQLGMDRSFLPSGSWFSCAWGQGIFRQSTAVVATMLLFDSSYQICQEQAKLEGHLGGD